MVEIDGVLYHKNTKAIIKTSINSLFGTTWVDKKEYRVEEETFNDGIRMGAEFAITGLIINKVAGIAGNLLRNAGNSLWKVAPLKRGFVYEKMLGGNLVKNYPVIDKFVNGVATSIKTLDVGAKSYLKGNNVFNKLKDYIDKLSSFKGREWSKIIIEEKDIRSWNS